MTINKFFGSFRATDVIANPNRKATSLKPQTNAVQTRGTMAVPVSGNVRDIVTISAQAQGTQVNSAVPIDEVFEGQAESGGTTFTSFAEEFSKITEGYANMIREHYAVEHEENLTYDNPNNHIWNKYKNPDSPDFRSDLSEDERAWAYDQKLDLLSGGKHLQMSNPYAFADAGGPPTLSSAAMQATVRRSSTCFSSMTSEFTGKPIPDENGRLVPLNRPLSSRQVKKGKLRHKGLVPVSKGSQTP